MKSNRNAESVKPRAMIRRAVVQGTILAGLAGVGSLWLIQTDAQEPQKPAPIKNWRQSGPWRAIGIVPRKMPQPDVANNQPINGIYEVHGQGGVRTASSEAVVTKLSESTPLSTSAPEPSGVVSAVANHESREPSLVKVPAVKLEVPKPIEAPARPLSSTEQETSRGMGAKVRLSMSTVSDEAGLIDADPFSVTNSSNLKVTRSGDITAETPVKVNFNQERILALPALPSPNSPYAESGIEIPVRVEAVAETVQSIIETQTPRADLPAIGILPVPDVDLNKVDLNKVDLNEIELNETELPVAEAPEADLVEVDLRQVDLREVNLGEVEPQIQANRPPMLQSPEPIITARISSESNIPESNIPETLPVEDSPELQTEPQSAQVKLNSVAVTEQTESNRRPAARGATRSLKAVSDGPVSAAPTIVALPSIDATAEEIQAISNLTRSTQPNGDGVLSQPGAPVLITTGPMVSSGEISASQDVTLESQAIRVLQVNGNIARLHVVDSSICQVVCNSNRLFIVGDQTGETMVEVNMGKMHKPMYIKVVVQRPWARSSSASVSLEQMQEIVTRLAPTAEVTVQPTDDGSLVVKGFAENNQQAKKVLETIRKMVLVPVVDQLEIR